MGKMRVHVRELTLLLFVFLALAGCNSGNNADNKLLEDRVADSILLKIKINEIESQRYRLITSNRDLSSNSSRYQKLINRNQAKISEFESEKEILLNKLNVIYETERE